MTMPRQLYFLFPPLFILAGLALEKIFTFLTHPPAKPFFS